MRRARKYTIIAAFIIVVLIIMYSLVIQIDQNSIITDKEMNNYMQTYVEKYRDLTETNIHSDRIYLKFYNEKPYFIRGVISTTHGAGLEFIPSKVGSSKIEITNKQIEEYFFNSSMIQYSLFPPITGYHNSIGNLSIEGMVPFKRILENGSILIWNLGVDKKIYNYIIIKGSNRKKDWTNLTASEDASSYFKDDIINAFSMSEEFRRYLAMPVLSNIANRILERNKNGYYINNYGLYNSDYEELYNNAKEYGVNSQFADDIYNFNEKETYIPSWWEQHDELGILRGLLLTLVISILGYLINTLRKYINKRKSIDR